MAAAETSAQDEFITAPRNSEWYKNLGRNGSCLKLFDMLEENAELLHLMGAGNITVLHKGVRHGCVKLVRYILVDMFDEDTECNFHIPNGGDNCTCNLVNMAGINLTMDGLLKKTTSDGLTAVAIAMMTGNPKMVKLLKWAIDMSNSGGSNQISGQVMPEFQQGSLLQDPLSSVMDKSEDWIGGDVSPKYEHHVWKGVTEYPLEVPNVKDDGIDGIYDSNWKEGVRVTEVYDIIRGVLEDGDDSYIQELMSQCREHVDFEFVPIEQVFLHFLAQKYSFDLMSNYFEQTYFGKKLIITQIIEMCKIDARRHTKGVLLKTLQIIKACLDDKGRGVLLKTLFNLHDPQGRTFLHVALEYNNYSFFRLLRLSLEHDFQGEYADCMNAKDGAGRTCLHALCIVSILKEPSHLEYYSSMETLDEIWRARLNWNVIVEPLNYDEWKALLKWRFANIFSKRYVNNGQLEPIFDADTAICYWACTPLHLAVIYNSHYMVKLLLESTIVHTIEQSILQPLQLAALLGRTEILDLLMKYEDAWDQGFGYIPQVYIRSTGSRYVRPDRPIPAIHCAAMSGHVEAMRTILKYPTYDPLIQTSAFGTALHIIVKLQKNMLLECIESVALSYIRPSQYKVFKTKIFKFTQSNDVPRMYSASEMNCINLLLQSGIDIWTPHEETNEHPCPGPMANDEALKWWYAKVISEVVSVKTSISYAANATSVIAALVATASFIGPFQPPLGYAQPNGYVHVDQLPVQIYLVSNGLSFYFSVASILMAVIPAIPMPKESMYDELKRSQRCLKVAAFMLLISIICILMSFSAASIAVVSLDWVGSRFVAFNIFLGGGICLIVVAIYIIRLLRMLFHRNASIRRMFAKYMYF